MATREDDGLVGQKPTPNAKAKKSRIKSHEGFRVESFLGVDAACRQSAAAEKAFSRTSYREGDDQLRKVGLRFWYKIQILEDVLGIERMMCPKRRADGATVEPRPCRSACV
jgi:hypothetical protein